VSSSILYDKSKTHNQFLSIINATVSHEMRNPMNSIKAENILKKELIRRLKELLERENISIEEF
jgi:signal transduction histidine kinase